MPLDKEALDSLRRTPGAGAVQYTRGPGKRRLWMLLGAIGVVAAIVFWRFAGAPVPVQTVMVEAPSADGDGCVDDAFAIVVEAVVREVQADVD